MRRKTGPMVNRGMPKSWLLDYKVVISSGVVSKLLTYGLDNVQVRKDLEPTTIALVSCMAPTVTLVFRCLPWRPCMKFSLMRLTESNCVLN